MNYIAGSVLKINRTSLFTVLTLGILICASCDPAYYETRTPGIKQAIAAGDVEALKAILESDPSAARARDLYKRTPLHYCTEETAVAYIYLKSKGKEPGSYQRDVKEWRANRKVMAELLISYGADVNAKDEKSVFPLYWTACSGNLELAKVLLENGADVNATDKHKTTALHLVAMWGATEFARYLIEKGANVNAMDESSTPLINAVEGPTVYATDLEAVRKQYKDMVELLLKNKADVHMKSRDGFAPIHLAYNKEIAQLLYSYGADLESRGYHQRTPLHRAAMGIRNDVVEWLCGKKVNVNAVDSDGHIPLTIAITQVGSNEKSRKASLETILILLRYGANVNHRDKKEGGTLLHVAALYHWQDLADVLLRHGADINAQNNLGDSALHIAVHGTNKAMVEVLVARGADVNVKNIQGRSPLDIVAHAQRGSEAYQIAQILRDRGEK